jgi:glyoxylase-like metal-dependent hydrolase (beta-lactamase superfamily II)
MATRSLAVKVVACACLLAPLAAHPADETWCGVAAKERAGLPAVDAGSDWFGVHAVADGVFAISEPRQYEGVNAFLVVGTDRAVLFDTGLGVAPIVDVVRRLTDLPVTVVNSHTHFDHVGGNSAFADVRNLDDPYSAANARGEVAVPLGDHARGTLDEARVCGPLPRGVDSREYRNPVWRAAGRLRDGDRIELGGRRLEVLVTPGHTPDSICLLDRANGLLFTGDTYYSGEIYLWSPETSIADYTASVDRLARLEPTLTRILPAHGRPVAEPARLSELRAALASIRTGRARAEPAPEGRLLYRFDHFSILKSL